MLHAFVENDINDDNNAENDSVDGDTEDDVNDDGDNRDNYGYGKTLQCDAAPPANIGQELAHREWCAWN
jgi:hypothetical protein